jgi:tetratricopeptide (TPR) repeat protein
MATQGDKDRGLRNRGLRDFLKDSFRPAELEMFLRLNGFAQVADAVNPNVGGVEYSFAVVRALDQRNWVDAEFFDRLAEERPAKDVEIRRLQRTWLGEGPEGPGGSGRPTRPCNLPLLSIGPLFKGRETFLDDLRRGLAAPDGRATAIEARQAVYGLGGVGKTRVAIEYAWRYARDYTALLFIFAPTAAEVRANLANLAGVLGVIAEGTSVEQQLATVLHWLAAHPGWLLILDSVDTEPAAQAVEELLVQLRAGHILITSRIANWSHAVQPLELDVLAAEAAVAFLMERAPQRREQSNDALQAAAIAGELDGLALALEQAGAYIDKLRLSFAEYLKRWEAKRAELLRWHNRRLMQQYPKSVAVTWLTTFAQLTETEQRLLEVLAWLAPEPIPLLLFEAEPLVQAIPEPRDALAGLMGYSLSRFDAPGNAVLVHRLVQEITRNRPFSRRRPEPRSWVRRLVERLTPRRRPEADHTVALEVALVAVCAVAPSDAEDIHSWEVWTALAAHAEAVSRLAEDTGLAELAGRLMSLVGLYRKTRGQFHAAEELARRVLAIAERSYGPDHPNVGIALSNLAELLQETNRLVEAGPLYDRALAIAQRSPESNQAIVAEALNNLAGFLRTTNRLADAETHYRRALAIGEQLYGPDHPHIARDLKNLAELLRITHRLDEAEPLYRRALAIDEQTYGTDHPVIANRINNLALLLRSANRLAEAEPHYRRALEINERSYGPDHPVIATALNNLAVLLKDTSRPAEAEPLFRRSLVIREQSLGRDHPHVATVLNNLAGLLRATDRPAEAEPLLRRAQAIDERSYGPDHPHVARSLNILALLLQATRRLAEAEPLFRRALAIYQRSYGSEHPEVAISLNNLAHLLAGRGDLAGAERLFRQALATNERALGPDHPSVATNLNNLALLLQSTRRLAEAEPLFRRGVQILSEFGRRTGHEHPNLSATLASYRRLLEAQGKTREQIKQLLQEFDGGVPIPTPAEGATGK